MNDYRTLISATLLACLSTGCGGGGGGGGGNAAADDADITADNATEIAGDAVEGVMDTAELGEFGDLMGLATAVTGPGSSLSKAASTMAMSTLAIYSFGGGVLHQMSIAALVIALGMLVDNAIVMAENIQWRLDRGDRPGAAAVAAVRELAVPLGAATATTIATFLARIAPRVVCTPVTRPFWMSIPVTSQFWIRSTPRRSAPRA